MYDRYGKYYLFCCVSFHSCLSIFEIMRNINKTESNTTEICLSNIFSVKNFISLTELCIIHPNPFWLRLRVWIKH